MTLLLALASIPPAALGATGALSWNGCVRAQELPSGGCYNANEYGLEQATAVAISPDGKSVYVASNGAYAFPVPGELQHGEGGVAVYRRDPSTGAIYWNGCLRDAAVPANGCYNSGEYGLGKHPSDLALSGDGTSLYVATDNLVLFRRDPATGNIYWNGCLTDAAHPAPGCWGVPGMAGARSVRVSADGRSVYVAASGDGYVGAVVILNRDPSTGNLYWNGCLSTISANACYAVDALGIPYTLTLDPDGTSVYFSAFNEQSGTLGLLRRDPPTGNLYWIGCFRDATSPVAAHDSGCYPVNNVAYPQHLVVSPDGRSVYVTSEGLTVFRRDPSNGYLYWDSCVRDATQQAGACAISGVHGFESGGWGVAVSPDGQSVYASSNGLDWPANPSALVVFNRDLGTGKLAWAGCFRDDGALNGCSKASGLDGAAGVALSADGSSVYIASMFSSALTVFARAAH